MVVINKDVEMKMQMHQELKFFVDNNSGQTMSFISHDNKMHMVVVQDEEITQFAGVASTNFFRIPMVPARMVDLLVKAFNNRTRERNYFRLYCQLLGEEITDDEFDNEIGMNESLYVVEAPEKMSAEDVFIAMRLSDRMMDIRTTDDFSSVFGIDDSSIDNYVKAIGNE